MNTMKRTLAVFAILLLACSFTAIAQTAPRHRFANPLLDDVAQMTGAGLPDATIEAYIQARQARLSADVTADDLIRLRDAGVSAHVVSYLAGVAGLQNYTDPNPQQPRAQAEYETSQDAGPPPDSGESYPVNVDTSGYGYPYWYGWGYGYPYWYGWWGYPYYGYGYWGWGGHWGHGHGWSHWGHGGWHGGGHGGHGGGHGGHSGGHSGGHGGGHR